VDGLPDGPFNSDLAIQLAYEQPEITDENLIVWLSSSNAAGDADQFGNSTGWRILFFNAASGESLDVQFLVGAGVFIFSGPELSECLENPPAGPPAPSRVVMSDAEQRWSPLDPYPETQKSGFYVQVAECAGENHGWTVMVRGIDAAGANPVTFYLDYTWEGEFLDMCGPCPDAACCDER
jgi:hypothetical protein